MLQRCKLWDKEYRELRANDRWTLIRLTTWGDATFELRPPTPKYPGGMVGNVPKFNRANVAYVKASNRLRS